MNVRACVDIKQKGRDYAAVFLKSHGGIGWIELHPKMRTQEGRNARVLVCCGNGAEHGGRVVRETRQYKAWLDSLQREKLRLHTGGLYAIFTLKLFEKCRL